MGQLVKPKVYLVGYTSVHMPGIEEYLKETGQEDFLESWNEAISDGLSPGEILCSFMAKLCYKSLVLGKNANVQRTRDISDNIKGCFTTGHGSVFEHCYLNFVVTNCSRVYTHEQVRHRQGWAYSQTSGRYCRLDHIDLVWDDILDPVKDLFLEHVRKTEELVYIAECKLGLRKPSPLFPRCHFVDYQLPDTELAARGYLARYVGGHPTAKIREDMMWVPDDHFNFEKRKKLTSAIRRIAPNGQANEIGMSVNIRALRHTVLLRTARHSEREIRDVYNQIYDLVRARFPLIFHGAKEFMHDGLREIRGMKMQPYEIEAGDPEALRFYTVEQMQTAIAVQGKQHG